MACDRILEANNKYNPSSNKIVYLDTFASRSFSQSEMFGSKFNQTSSITNFQQTHNPQTTPNVSLFNRSLVSVEDLEELLEVRKRNMTEELLRMRAVNQQLQVETKIWRKR